MGLPLSSLSLAAIFCGAGLGALLRVWFNTVSVGLSAIVPMGTLISNLLGCYLVGIALAYFTSHPRFRLSGDFLSSRVFWEG